MREIIYVPGFMDYFNYNDLLRVRDQSVVSVDRTEILGYQILDKIEENVSSDLYFDILDVNRQAVTYYNDGQPDGQPEQLWGWVNDQNRERYINYVKTNVDNETWGNITTYREWASIPGNPIA